MRRVPSSARTRAARAHAPSYSASACCCTRPWSTLARVKAVKQSGHSCAYCRAPLLILSLYLCIALGLLCLALGLFCLALGSPAPGALASGLSGGRARGGGAAGRGAPWGARGGDWGAPGRHVDLVLQPHSTVDRCLYARGDPAVSVRLDARRSAPVAQRTVPFRICIICIAYMYTLCRIPHRV